MKVVIMAGGKGTRIASVRSDVPKPMINICGKPILEYQIDNLKACGLTDIILVIGYLGDKIKEYFGDGSKFGVNIEYFPFCDSYRRFKDGTSNHIILNFSFPGIRKSVFKCCFFSTG